MTSRAAGQLVLLIAPMVEVKAKLSKGPRNTHLREPGNQRSKHWRPVLFITWHL